MGTEDWIVDRHTQRIIHRPTGSWFGFDFQRPGSCSYHAQPQRGVDHQDLATRAIELASQCGLYCNAMTAGMPIAAWKDDDGTMKFYDPVGFCLRKPDNWRWTPLEEIDKELAAQGTKMITGGRQWP